MLSLAVIVVGRTSAISVSIGDELAARNGTVFSSDSLSNSLCLESIVLDSPPNARILISWPGSAEFE